MSHTKAGGSTRNGRDSKSKRLGVKLFGGQIAQPGDILIRQRGSKYHAGTGTSYGKDYTIFATQDGEVSFTQKSITSFTGSKQRKTIVHVGLAELVKPDQKATAAKK